MSLKFLSKITRSYGIGYKVVRKIDDETYAPYFEYFLKGGGGGTELPENPTADFLRSVVRVRVTYRIYERARLKHRRVARTMYLPEKLYFAGFHLWTNLQFTRERLEVLRVLNPELSLTILKCNWAYPIACDDKTVVVKSFTPVEEILDDEIRERTSDNGG